MIRDNIMNRLALLVALSLIVVWPSLGRAQDTYAAVQINNITSLPINYFVRWGSDGKWTEVDLKPGRYWRHWYPADRAVPTLEIIFNSGIGKKRSEVTYRLEPLPTGDKLVGGRPYHFDKKNDKDGDYINLFTGTGKKTDGDADNQSTGGLIGSTWSGIETLPGYGALTFRFKADGVAVMIDKNGDTSGTWKQAGNNVTIQFGAKLSYIGTIKGNTMKGSAASAGKKWTFSVSDPNMLLGSIWTGTETLPNYGALTFRFFAGGQATMTDKDGDTSGTFKQSGNSFTLNFEPKISYTGTVQGNTMKGTATNGSKNWTFAMTNPNSIADSTAFQRAMDLCNKGDHEQAIEKFTDAIRAEPKNVPLYYGRAYSYWSKGDFEKALADCEEAIRREPKNAYAYSVRGLVFREQGEVDEAIKEHTKAIELAPKIALFYSHRGLAQVVKKSYEEAIKDQSEAIRLSPERTDFLVRRGLAYLSLQSFERGIEDFSEAIRLQPDVASHYVFRGLGYIRVERLAEAIADCTEAIRLDPKSAIAFSNRGAAYYKKQQYQRTIDDCTESIRLNPNLGRAFWWRSKAYAKIGPTSKAEADYLQSIRLDPSNQQLSIDVENAGRSFAPVAQRQEALRALRSFQLGSTLSPKRLYEINKFPQYEPVAELKNPLPKETRELIKLEKIRHDALEAEMVAAADRFLTAAKLSPAVRKAEGIDLQWLYGPVSPIVDRAKSQDDLAGMRLIGRLVFKDGREITAIFPITFFPKIGEEGKNGEEGRRGHPGILWGADNFRIAVKLYTSGTVKQDYAHQSFSVSNKEDGTQSMRPGLNVDSDTGMLVDPYIRGSSLGTRCFDCHSKGTNLNLKGNDYYYNQMKEKNYKAMKGFDGFLKLAAELGATKSDREELERSMIRDPALLIPVDELIRANEEYWIRRYPAFKKRLTDERPKQLNQEKSSAAPAQRNDKREPIVSSLPWEERIATIFRVRPNVNHQPSPLFWRNENAFDPGIDPHGLR